MLPLVILDIDGTILGHQTAPTQAFVDKVAEVKERGMRLAICTGRLGAGVGLHLAQLLDTELPHIFQNGAVMSYADGRIFAEHTLAKKTLQTLVAHAQETGRILELYSHTTYYVEHPSDITEFHASLLDVAPTYAPLAEVLDDKPIVRAQWTVPNEAMPELRALALPDANMYVAKAGSREDLTFASITKAGISKGSAVRALAEHLGLNLKRVMGVGDSTGDIPYLDIVGHPRAMANGATKIKEAYTVVPSVDEDGVVVALNQALAL